MKSGTSHALLSLEYCSGEANPPSAPVTKLPTSVLRPAAAGSFAVAVRYTVPPSGAASSTRISQVARPPSAAGTHPTNLTSMDVHVDFGHPASAAPSPPSALGVASPDGASAPASMVASPPDESERASPVASGGAASVAVSVVASAGPPASGAAASWPLSSPKQPSNAHAAEAPRSPTHVRVPFAISTPCYHLHVSIRPRPVRTHGEATNGGLTRCARSTC